jgi:hypothetical protein
MRTLHIQNLDSSALSKKRRRQRDGPPEPLDALPGEWKAMAARWAKRGEKSATGCRWDTLAKEAGPEGFNLAQRLLAWMVDAGWIAVVEERRHGAWSPARIEFTDLAGLRIALGLPDPAMPARRWAELRAALDRTAEPELAIAMARLDSLPAGRAADRAELLLALARWRHEERSGTRRDFAHFARGATKSVTDAEWRWLEEAVDLAAFAIERHTPLMLVAAPLALELSGGILDLGAAPDFASLTPATIAAARSASGTIARWQLVENRTSFERVARGRERDTAVVWLPGFPPDWWREAMARLLRLAPAEAEIACDPDPAGIAIALEAGALWDEAGIPWRPWCMDVESLVALPARRALDTADREVLGRLLDRSLPASLDALVRWMREHGEKGEQEGFL